VVQVEAGDAEPAGCNLLDRAGAQVAVLVRQVARRVLPAFSGVALAADAVHGNGQCLVRLRADGAVGHRTGLEPLADLFNRLDLIDRHGLGRGKLEQMPQNDRRLGRIVDLGRIFLEGGVAARAAGNLQVVHGQRVEVVIFAVRTPLVLAACVQHIAARPALRKCRAVPAQGLLLDHLHASAAHAGGRAVEIAIDQLLFEP